MLLPLITTSVPSSAEIAPPSACSDEPPVCTTFCVKRLSVIVRGVLSSLKTAVDNVVVGSSRKFVVAAAADDRVVIVLTIQYVDAETAEIPIHCSVFASHALQLARSRRVYRSGNH